MMTTIRNKQTSLVAAIAILAVLAGHTACQKFTQQSDGSPHAVAAFVIGTVTLERTGETARPVAYKDELRSGDVIKTGNDSALVIQIGDDSVVKIDKNSAVRLTSMFEEGKTRLHLDEGKIFSQIRYLRKKDSFTIQTKTSLAAVRGTDFSVESDDKGSVVAVTNGAVGVQRLDENEKVQEETSVAQGNSAVVDDKIETRPLSEAEKAELDHFSEIDPVENIDEKDTEKLKEIEHQYFTSAETGEQVSAEQPDEEPVENTADTGEISDKKPAAARASEEPPQEPVSKGESGKVWTSKKAYSAGEQIIVKYKNLPQYRNCWIDISRSSDTDGRYQGYSWTYGASDGEMKFDRLNLQAGSYQVRVHYDRGNTVNKRFSFRVK